MTETPDNTPTSGELLVAAFERLPIAEQLDRLEEFIGVINDRLGKLNDPDLDHHLDLIYCLRDNIANRFEEIVAVYGHPEV